MPPIETSSRLQKAVLWEASGTDDYAGKVNAAVELDVRWEYTEREVTDAQGNQVAITATVIVDRDVAVGSIMWLGTLAAVPTPKVDLHCVVSFTKTPDIKNREYRRELSLARYNDTLPSINS